jgi:large subunit ribosomal protein L22
MADENQDKKQRTKKDEAAKASAEKAKAKKAAKKDDAKASKSTKKAAAKKDSKAKGKEKKPAAKKASKEKKPAKKAAAKKEPAKKAAPKAPAAPPVVKASARYVRIAPRKARLIADQVRGMHIESARALLQFSPRGAAHPIHKLINSAAANAENNHDLIGDEMRIASITVDEGPTLRRFRPRAMGRATPINKRTSHIRVALTPAED